MSANTRLLCPVETCRRAFKSKTTWTRHLRIVHPLQNQDATVITLPSSPIRHNYRPIQASPPTSPADGHESNVEDFAPPAEVFLGTFDLLPFIQQL